MSLKFGEWSQILQHRRAPLHCKLLTHFGHFLLAGELLSLQRALSYGGLCSLSEDYIRGV
jgi:hypothetical protein